MINDRATVTGIAVVRNASGEVGGGITLDAEPTLSSVGSDWGADADGADATFDCDAEGCAP